jgi:cysteine synthase
MGDNDVLPPWGKLMGIDALMASGCLEKGIPLTHLSVDGSWSGWALAAMCQHYGIQFRYAFPDSKRMSRVILDHVASRYPQTVFHPLKPHMSSILYNRLRSQAKAEGWQMLPRAFDHPIYWNALGERVRRCLEEIGGADHLVISSGSGVSVGSVCKALGKGFSNVKVHTATVSTISTVERKITAICLIPPVAVDVEKSPYSFDDRLEGREAPFPCNQFWDMKQWVWLEENLHSLEGKVLFWNLGGRYTF